MEIAEKATEGLGLFAKVKSALREDYKLVEAAVFEDGTEGAENTIGTVTIYRQNINGIPLENNFIAVCTDCEGVFAIINRWADISAGNEAEEARGSRDESLSTCRIDENTLQSLRKDNQTAEYVYRQGEDGTYTLAIKVSPKFQEDYYIDAYTGVIN